MGGEAVGVGSAGSTQPGVAALRVTPDGFKQKMGQITEEAVSGLFEIWREAGYDEGECQTLLGDLLGKIKNKYSEELLAEKHILDHAKSQVINKLKYYNDQCQKLGRTGKHETNIGVNCTDRLVTLDRLILEIDQEIGQREKVFKIEIDKNAYLSKLLGEPVRCLDDFRGPVGTTVFSDVRLTLIKEHMSTLEQVKNKRLVDVSSIADNCCQVMADLEVFSEGWKTVEVSNPSRDVSSFTPHTLRSDLMNQCVDALRQYSSTGQKSHIGLHLDDLTKLQLCHCTLVKEKENRRDELARLGSEIARLWTLLRVPASDRDHFQSSFKMNLSMETLMKGAFEYTRLLALRKTSLRSIIGSIRAEIQGLWEESGVDSTDVQNSEFPAFFLDIDALEDASVEVHEEYLSRLKLRVNDLRPILSKIYKREQVVQERIELEQLQLNPERLTARGPSAREDRKREEGMINRVKMLDKLTKEIVSQVQVWEDSYGPLVFAGERYIDRISHQEDKYIEIRDSLRNNRKRKDSIQTGDMASSSASGKFVSGATNGAKTATGGVSTGALSASTIANRKMVAAPSNSSKQATIFNGAGVVDFGRYVYIYVYVYM